ncbi:hypothetical protein CBS101457_000825 [Exobasidium rhododendri]|nr:hypothetical protein CBS101457_000825 [Exobasidium rhododendri]
MSATLGVSESSKSGGAVPIRPGRASTRSSSTRSHPRQRSGIHTGGGYTADFDIDDDEEGDLDGEDGDDDEDDQVITGENSGGKDLINESTLKSGYLWKRGEKRKNWKKRWFVLRSSKLCYYKNEKEYQLLRFIDMSDVHTVAAIALKKNQNSFGIVTSKRQYYTRASSAKEMQDWIDALKDAQEQARQTSTLSKDMGAIDIGTSSGNEGPSGHVISQRNASASPSLLPIDRQHSIKGTNHAAPINIVIPGKGLYASPAQARQNSTGTSIISPLTATSDSELGAPSGAEQFGLSYASSTGQSLASSPNRGGPFYHFDLINSGGDRQSPQNQSGGDDANEGHRRAKTIKKVASGNRDTSIGSSGGEGSTSVTTGWTAAAGRPQHQAAQHQQQSAGILSSSDEDGDGEEGEVWDEDEVADRAMPLPGSTGIGVTQVSHPTQLPGPIITPNTPSNATAGNRKVEYEFSKDLNKVIHQGYLMKQSSRRKQWRKRWFTLTSTHLSYTRSHMSGKPQRQIPLTSILDAIEYVSKKAGTHLQSPLPSSPGPQSPPLNTNSISFQIGNSMEAGAGSHAGTREGMLSPSDMSAIGAASATASTPHPLFASGGDYVSERRNSGANVGIVPAPQPKRKKEHCFKIITPNRTYVVCAPTEEEEIKWLSALQALLAHWRGTMEVDAEAPAATAASQPIPAASYPSHQTVPQTFIGSSSPPKTANRALRRLSTNEDVTSS